MMNEENSYNLIDEPWIPVLMQDGTNRLVSLGEVFADANGGIADLALNPYERVAVFRLLLCITQAALGSKRLKDERSWRELKSLVGPMSADYLKKWHDRFFLYGSHAFLQPDDVDVAKKKQKAKEEKEKNDDDSKFNATVNKLCLARSSGNNSTLFDHAAVASKGCVLPDETLALGLLTYQSFSSGGTSGVCLWSKTATDQYIKGAPCRESSMLFTILLGESLLETVWLNLLTAKTVSDLLAVEWGTPSWELSNLSRTKAVCLAKTFLGHLAPMSRAVKLTRGNSLCVLGGGVVYPDLSEWREPMASVKPKQDGTLCYISSDSNRMPWRDLTSILAVRESCGRKSALALSHLESLPEEKEFVLWTGGLCSEKAKEINVVEWRALLSVELLEDINLKKYESAINLADRQNAALYFACKKYALHVKTSDSEKQIKKQQENELVLGFYIPAERIYWDILAQPDNQRLVLAVDSSTYMDDWKRATQKAAEEAYRRTCPSAMARQMEAYAQGYSKLLVPDNSNESGASNPAEETI